MYPSPLPLRTSTAPQTSFRELERLGLGFELFGEAIVFPPPSESLFPFRLESLFPGKGDGFDREIERKRERGRRRRGWVGEPHCTVILHDHAGLCTNIRRQNTFCMKRTHSTHREHILYTENTFYIKRTHYMTLYQLRLSGEADTRTTQQRKFKEGAAGSPWPLRWARLPVPCTGRGAPRAQG